MFILTSFPLSPGKECFNPGTTPPVVRLWQVAQEISLLASSIYRLKYTFPKKIKSVSVENAMISQDGKTVEVEFTLNVQESSSVGS